MELALSLGDAPKPLSFLDKPTTKLPNKDSALGFCIALGSAAAAGFTNGKADSEEKRSDYERTHSSDPLLQLNLLPSTPVLRSHPSSQLRIPWLSDALGMKRVASGGVARVLDENRFTAAAPPSEDADEGGARSSSPNSAVSSFQMDFCIGNGNAADAARYRREHDGEADRASDDEENGSTRKKLRLSKEQSAFLEESFKEHTTLNPKQKLALAKQLNLRPRQVEVWFQNRRARTKLKQTEVDCEYLKRCCDTLTEENRRLQKELQELRALKTSQPFYMQLPATTLTMCPSCERVATNSTGTTATAANNNNYQTTPTTAATTNNSNGSQIPAALSLNKSRILPFPNIQAQAHQMAS